MRILIYIAFLAFLIGCKESEKTNNLLFTDLSAEETNIDFINSLQLSGEMDVFRYRNYYNGGGVAIGDINNDGLADIFFSSNMGKNQLYLNEGDFKFKNITEESGVGGGFSWSTGVSLADVNGDGLLDIYVCNSGDRTGGRRNNELFINNGDLTFREEAEEYGLDDKGFTTHAAFFDYDNDGDLDCYILNNSFRPVSSLGLENIRHVRDSTGGDKLYKNENNHFVDVSEEAGIFGSVIGFGLGVTATDINLDGWIDIYISNDFFERDYLYINRKDGTYKEELPKRFGHVSHFSMGADAADLNNDGAPDIYVTDMLPADNYRLKTTTNFENYDLLETKRKNDYYEQYMRNTLQMNSGSGFFDEVGQQAGVSATDWSWGALLADFDNDGIKEIFVTNGIYKDITDRDFIDYLASDETKLTAMRSERVDFEKLVEKMPSNPISNYMFRLDSGALKYNNVTEEWGMATPSHSNGAAYGDLDNDGDLDLIVNNLNSRSFIYQNNSESIAKKNYLKVRLKGKDKNTFGIGARVNLYTNGKLQMLENLPNKGFQSSMNNELIFGLDTATTVDSLIIFWNHELRQKLENISANGTIAVNIKDALNHPVKKLAAPKLYTFDKSKNSDPVFKHQENPFIDFDRERMIYHMLSREGPALAIGDINDDDLDDFFIGGASKQSGALYIQQKDGNYRLSDQQSFLKDADHEDVDAIFFDADNDGDQDLYVVSGGYEFSQRRRELIDRLYINNSGEFIRSKGLPEALHLGSCVISNDYDKDGDIDLFIGGRAIPADYGASADSYLLENDGKGNFTNVTGRVAPQLINIGMVTDAVWADYDGDNDDDLVLVGEWMPITLFKNSGGNLQKLNNVPGLVNSNGWWNTIHAADLNDDGKMDFIAGNWGLNSMFKASDDAPVNLYVKDFDNNGTKDHIFTFFENGIEYPFALRDEILRQLPGLKKNNIYYKDYASKSVQDLFGEEGLSNAVLHSAYQLSSSIIYNKGNATFELKALPEEFQRSPIFSMQHLKAFDFLMAGNFYPVKPEEGRYDANHGQILSIVDGEPVFVDNHNMFLNGEVRDLGVARSSDGKQIIIVARNNDEVEFYIF